MAGDHMGSSGSMDVSVCDRCGAGQCVLSSLP
jgi:hypothetical protein